MARHHLKITICQSDYYNEKLVKCLFEGILEEKRESRESELENIGLEERKQMKELELERLRAKLRNKLKEREFNMKARDKRNNLANVCYLLGNCTVEVSEPISKGGPLINPVVNKSVEDAMFCDFETENCDPLV
ncbi:hypothetical protein TNCV_81381 [Trichonephila clavipes]|nr:hypothetical protein TNCV_81381 [Trichonephila clavipes]